MLNQVQEDGKLMKPHGLARQGAFAAGGAGLLLLAPLGLTLLNQDSHLNGGEGGGWDWGPLDFLIMGALLFAAGLGLQLALKRLPGPVSQIAGVLAILAAASLTWVELATGGLSRIVVSLFDR
jgi:hypothetical protein